MRRKAKKDTERVRLPAERSIDPKVITDYWRSRPANEHLDDQELRIKTIVLTKLFWGARAKDLEGTCTLCLICYVFDPRDDDVLKHYFLDAVSHQHRLFFLLWCCVAGLRGLQLGRSCI